MKHSLSLTAALLTVVALTVFGLYSVTGQGSENDLGEDETVLDENESEFMSVQNPSVGSQSEKMLLKVFDGKLALFIGDGRYPSEIYDLLIRSLPAEDQSRLKTGIEVSSSDELKRLLEDFMS